MSFRFLWYVLLLFSSSTSFAQSVYGTYPKESECRQNDGNRWCEAAPSVPGATTVDYSGLASDYFRWNACSFLTLNGAKKYFRNQSIDSRFAKDGKYLSGVPHVWQKQSYPYSVAATDVVTGSNNCTKDKVVNGYYPLAVGIGQGEYACKPGFALGESKNSELCIGDVVGYCKKYPDNNTAGCGKSVADLETALSKISTGNPTRGFVEAHLCIAKAGCNSRCLHQNCKWMDRVVPEFVKPFIDKSGKWKEIEKACNTPGHPYNLVPLVCERVMAEYHIYTDLLGALTRQGCGSASDWAEVGRSITTCTASRLGFIASMVDGTVQRMRDEVREKCISARTTKNLPIVINSGLEGKTCDQ